MIYWGGQKIDTFIDIPLRLSLNGKHYCLHSVINHYGSSGGGHYTAHTLKGGQWFCHDDSSVQEMEESQVVTSAAYILLYR